MSVMDAQVPVQHRVFVANTGPQTRHGMSDEGELSDPITRYVYQVYPARWQRPIPDPINTEDYDRTVSNMLMDTPEPEVYKKRDQVLVNGIAFEVQGQPEVEAWDNGAQLMSEYDDMFGGQILIRRVT